MKPFDFGSAAKLYARSAHPRLLLGIGDIQNLRRQTRRGDGLRLLSALRRKVRPFVDDLLRDEQWTKTIETGRFFWPVKDEAFVWALPDIALVGLIDEDPRALDAGTRVLRAIATLGLAPRDPSRASLNYYMPPLYVPYAYDLLAEHLDQATRRQYVAAAQQFHIHAVLTGRRANYLKGSAINMTLGGMMLALTTLLAIAGDPGAADLEAARAELILWLEATLNTAVGPDGFPEEDIGYGTVVTPMLVQVVEMLYRGGIFDAYAACPHIARFGSAMLHMVQPWGEQLSNTGDHGDQLRERQFVLPRLASRRADPTLLWLTGAITYCHSRTFITDDLSKLEFETKIRPGFSLPVSWLSLVTLGDLGRAKTPGQAKTPTAYQDRGRGIVTFRSGWGKDDTFVLFDGSQRNASAPGHCHDSCGHVSVSALGEYFAIDTGRYNIEQDCHNVVLVDGKSGRSTQGEWVADYHAGVLTGYQPGALVDSASVDSSHQHNCMWARRWLGLVKPVRRELPGYVWMVDDINKANDWAEFCWQLHTSPENLITIDGERATIKGWRHGNLLDVHFTLPHPAEYSKAHTLALSQDVATPSSKLYVRDPVSSAARFPRPADMLHGPVFLRPRLLAKVGGYNGRFMALLLPRGKNQPPARVERLPTLVNALAARVTFAKVQDTLIWAFEHRLLDADNIRARGNWCVVRRSIASGKVLAHAMGAGVSLQVDGRQLPLS